MDVDDFIAVFINDFFCYNLHIAGQNNCFHAVIFQKFQLLYFCCSFVFLGHGDVIKGYQSVPQWILDPCDC